MGSTIEVLVYKTDRQLNDVYNVYVWAVSYKDDEENICRADFFGFDAERRANDYAEWVQYNP